MKQSMSSQMLKGILQGMMLIILSRKPDYGYGISKQMNDYGLEGIPKGTIYPLLAAMERRGLIIGKMQPSQEGPDRKYYYVTPVGEVEMQAFLLEWDILANVVNRMIEGEKKMNTNQMIEENNQLRQRLNDENKAYYNDLLIYLRFQSVSRDEAQIESFLLDVLQDILAAQKDGLSAVDYFGKEPKEVADAFLAEVPRSFWAVLKLALIAVGSYMGITIFPTLTTTGKPTDVGTMLIAGLYTLLMIMILFKYLAVTIYRVSTWCLHKVMQWLIWCLIGIIALAPLSLITILVKTPVRISLDGIWGIGVILLGWLIGGIVYLRLTDKQMWTPFVIVALAFGIMGIIARIPHFDALLSMKSGRYLYAGLMVIVMIVFYLMSYFAVKKMKKSE